MNITASLGEHVLLKNLGFGESRVNFGHPIVLREGEELTIRCSGPAMIGGFNIDAWELPERKVEEQERAK